METLTLTGDAKSMHGWEEVYQPLSKYLLPGDMVDLRLVEYAYEVVPPLVMSSTLVQMGEPVDHNGEGRALYYTFQKHCHRWVYTGVRVYREEVAFEGTLPKAWVK